MDSKQDITGWLGDIFMSTVFSWTYCDQQLYSIDWFYFRKSHTDSVLEFNL